MKKSTKRQDSSFSKHSNFLYFPLRNAHKQVLRRVLIYPLPPIRLSYQLPTKTKAMSSIREAVFLRRECEESRYGEGERDNIVAFYQTAIKKQNCLHFHEETEAVKERIE